MVEKTVSSFSSPFFCSVVFSMCGGHRRC
jgi:hypothetical protein